MVASPSKGPIKQHAYGIFDAFGLVWMLWDAFRSYKGRSLSSLIAAIVSPTRWNCMFKLFHGRKGRKKRYNAYLLPSWVRSRAINDELTGVHGTGRCMDTCWLLVYDRDSSRESTPSATGFSHEINVSKMSPCEDRAAAPSRINVCKLWRCPWWGKMPYPLQTAIKAPVRNRVLWSYGVQLVGPTYLCARGIITSLFPSLTKDGKCLVTNETSKVSAASNYCDLISLLIPFGVLIVLQ